MMLRRLPSPGSAARLGSYGLARRVVSSPASEALGAATNICFDVGDPRQQRFADAEAVDRGEPPRSTPVDVLELAHGGLQVCEIQLRLAVFGQQPLLPAATKLAGGEDVSRNPLRCRGVGSGAWSATR